MADPVKLRNAVLGKTVVERLNKRHFEAYYAEDAAAARAKVLELIPAGHVVSWGGSVTLSEIGVLEAVKKTNPVIDRDTAKSVEERMEMVRQALLCDTFLMSANAISEDGQLVNIDGNGNRCAALIYGPKQVIVVAGVNKIAADLDAAIARARHTAAPINTQRFPGISTPCAKTGVCADCLSPESICAHMVISRHCRQPGRIKAIIVGENLGY